MNVQSQQQLQPVPPFPEFASGDELFVGRVLGEFSKIITATQQLEEGTNAMKRTIKIPSAIPMAAALVAFALITAPAMATPGSGFAPSPIVNGHFGTVNMNTADDKTGKWGLIMKTLDDTDIGADRLTVQPNGFSGWHAHPGPVIATVTRGTIIWYDGSDPVCAPHTISTGESFIEVPYKSYNNRNASDSTVAEFVAVTIKPEGYVGPAFRLDRPEPTNCKF